MPRRSLAGLLAAWAALSPTVAAGHAIVLESIPIHDAVLDRTPERVFLRFNSRIERDFTRVTLTRGDGRPLPRPVRADGAGLAAGPDRVVVPLRPLPGGTYVLRYRVLAADGHVTEGALRFTVREAP